MTDKLDLVIGSPGLSTLNERYSGSAGIYRLQGRSRK